MRERERVEMEKTRSKEEERRFIADWTGFDNYKIWLEAQALIKSKSRRRNEINNNKDGGQISLEKAEALAVSDKLNVADVIDLSSPLKSNEVIEVPAENIETTEMKSKGQKVDTAKHINTVENIETELFEIKDNIVLRQLLRKPRYFDPPSESRMACPCCGEEGHIPVRCKLRNRKNPCFVCGSSKHIWRRCKQRRRILQLKKEQENQSNPDTCLRCRGSGHDIFSCTSDYSLDDLKEIQCYICRKFGHLCCSDLPNLSPTELSCCNCGESGHLGSECKNFVEPNNGPKGSITCFKCGERRHANGCTDKMKDDGKGTDNLQPRYE